MSVSVSIIVPVYQVEAYIEDCLRSVMRRYFEYICSFYEKNALSISV